MSVNIARKGIIYLIAGLFFLVGTAAPGYGETNYGELLTVLKRGELYTIIDAAKETLEKNPEDRDSLKTLGIAYHNLSTIGVKSAAKDAVKYLKRAKKLYPYDALVLAMLGSSTTLLGKYSDKKVTEGRRLSNKGGGMLDRAVMMAPDDVLVRMVRANNSRGLPTFFGRRHYFKNDMLHVEKLIEASPDKYHGNLKAQVYYKLGTAYQAEKDDATAVSYFKKAVQAAPDSKWARKAKREL